MFQELHRFFTFIVKIDCEIQMFENSVSMLSKLLNSFMSGTYYWSKNLDNLLYFFRLFKIMYVL